MLQGDIWPLKARSQLFGLRNERSRWVIPLLAAGNRSTFLYMSIAVMIRVEEMERLLPWAEAVARARGEDLLLVRASKDGSSESTGEFSISPTEDLLTWIREEKFDVSSELPSADSDVLGSSSESP